MVDPETTRQRPLDQARVLAYQRLMQADLALEGLRRRGFSAEAISALRSAYRVLYKSGATLEEAREELRETLE